MNELLNKIMAWSEGKWFHDPLLMLLMILSSRPVQLIIFLVIVVGLTL